MAPYPSFSGRFEFEHKCKILTEIDKNLPYFLDRFLKYPRYNKSDYVSFITAMIQFASIPYARNGENSRDLCGYFRYFSRDVHHGPAFPYYYCALGKSRNSQVISG